MKKQAGYPCDKEQPKTSHLSNRSKFASSFFNSYSECIMRTLCTHSCPLFQDIPSWPPLHPQKQNNPHFFIAVRIFFILSFSSNQWKKPPSPNTLCPRASGVHSGKGCSTLFWPPSSLPTRSVLPRADYATPGLDQLCVQVSATESNMGAAELSCTRFEWSSN